MKPVAQDAITPGGDSSQSTWPAQTAQHRAQQGMACQIAQAAGRAAARVEKPAAAAAPRWGRAQAEPWQPGSAPRTRCAGCPTGCWACRCPRTPAHAARMRSGPGLLATAALCHSWPFTPLHLLPKVCSARPPQSRHRECTAGSPCRVYTSAECLPLSQQQAPAHLLCLRGAPCKLLTATAQGLDRQTGLCNGLLLGRRRSCRLELSTGKGAPLADWAPTGGQSAQPLLLDRSAPRPADRGRGAPQQTPTCCWSATGWAGA